MKFLNPSELSNLIYEDYKGTNFDGYKFKINNSPTLRVSKQGKIISCTCQLHSIKLVKEKACRFTIAFELLEQLSLELSELSRQYSDKYNRFNQLLVKWKKKNLIKNS